jgi:hypothetical protein
MANVIIAKSFLAVAGNSMFNKSEWKPIGEAYSLKDIWDTTNPGLYEEIKGDEAEVVAVSFESGDALRIEVPFKDGTSIQLKLAKGDYEEGDKIRISSITGQELRKVGSDPIVRYSGEVI